MQNQKGFSLIEALAAIGLCTMIIFTLVAVLNYSLYLNAYSKNQLIAMNDARRVMEQVRAVADTNGLTGAGSVSNPGTPWSDFLSNNLPGEEVEVIISGTNPLDITVRVLWDEKNRKETFEFVTKVTRR